VKRFFGIELRLRLKKIFDQFDYAIHKEKEMADFRKVSVLIALALLLGFATTASAQITSSNLTCTASAQIPPTVRQQGYTELVGDALITCTGGTPTVGTWIPQVNIQLYLNTNVTSRTYDSNGLSEVLLLVDDPGSTVNPSTGLVACTTPTTGCTFTAASSYAASSNPGFEYGTSGPSPLPSRPNVFRGYVSGSTITFYGIPVDAPGSQASRYLRVTNIRANVTGVAAGSNSTPGTVQALVTSTANTSTGLSIASNTVTLGYVQSGLSFVVRTRSNGGSANTTTDISYAQCSSLSRTSSSIRRSFVSPKRSRMPSRSAPTARS